MEMPHVDARASRLRLDDASPNIRALIVDDDQSARDRLRILAGATSGVEIIGECTDGRDAVDAILTSSVDLVFLSIELPRLDGFGVIAAIGAGHMPALIFTSQSPQFAMRAFEAHALDYLLKPLDGARFFAAVERARQHIDMRRALKTVDVLPPQRATYHEAIAIRTGDQYEVVRVPEIDWIEASGNYSKLYMRQRSRILTKTLATLEKQVLDPAMFVRVHRSAIVNSAKITAVEPHYHGELTLVLQNGAQVQCSRRFRHFLEKRLYFTT